MNGKHRTAAVLIALFWAGSVAQGATDVSTDIEGDTTWTRIRSPYVITNSFNFSPIVPGPTLTIEPGVEVRMAPHATLNIFGNLQANGTEADPITFVSTVPDGDWRINIFNSSDSELTHVTSESTQGTIAIYDSTVTISDLSSDSELMLFNDDSTISDTDLTGGRIYSNGGIANIEGLISTGSNNGFYDTDVRVKDATVSHTNSTPALIVTDKSAYLENVSIDDASHGIIASNVPQLIVRNADIKNIEDDGFIFDGGTADLSHVTIENAYYGAGLQGSVVSLENLHISDIQSPALQIDADNTVISDSTFTSGANTGVSIEGQQAKLRDVTISNFPNAPGLLPSTDSLQAERLVLTDNLIGVYNSGSTTVRRSKISGNTVAGIINTSGATDARQTYWGDPAGPTAGDPADPATVGKGDAVWGDVLYEPWLTEYCETNCYSNIMFLPGIMSSRLYENGEQLWEPGVFTPDNDFEDLYLDQNGVSINSDIYTKDVLNNGYAYGKFMADLADLKAAGTINDFEAVPYDWRLAMADVLGSGLKESDGSIFYNRATSTPYIEETLRRLAATSKSGKVTIIAHSNGGLVTKALINQLGGEAAELIDQIIFVAVPQLGTPQAIGALLHGYNAGQPSFPYPFILSEERARDLAINMPMIYQLLPFADYYNGDGATVNTPYVTFEDGTATQPFIQQYGYAVTPDELEDFLDGAEGRNSAAYADLEDPINANARLVTEAQRMQQAINSSWKPPAGIQVSQIAGTGEATLAGITYETIQKCTEHTIIYTCAQYDDALSYKPNTVLDGDGTVVVPSALAMSTSDENIERWWVNLYSNNIENFRFGPLKKEHSDILEVDELREFIFNNLVTNTTIDLPKYISSATPTIEGKDRLIFTLHSPLALSAMDADGNTTNATQAFIPGATYTRYGEVQVLTIPTGIKFTLVLSGEAEGSFTLEMEELYGNNLIATSTFSAIPTSTSTLATITFTEGSLQNAGALQVDYNGDSIVDLTYTPIIGQTIMIPDILTTDTSTNVGGNSRPWPQVLGASTDLAQFTNLVRQLQIAITNLTSLKNQIPDKQYSAIASQLQVILNTLTVRLQTQEGIK